jgi:hypothetical protein
MEDENRNVFDGDRLRREMSEIRCTEMRFYFTSFRSWNCLPRVL